MIMAGAAGNVASVCLLIALSRVIPGMPLLVAANRDERYDRPAEPVTVLRAAASRGSSAAGTRWPAGPGSRSTSTAWWPG